MLEEEIQLNAQRLECKQLSLLYSTQCIPDIPVSNTQLSIRYGTVNKTG